MRHTGGISFVAFHGALFANSSILTSFFSVEKWTADSPSGENPPKILVSLLLRRLL
jgi:hypothetical protein